MPTDLRVIHFNIAMQRLPRGIHHRASNVTVVIFGGTVHVCICRGRNNASAEDAVVVGLGQGIPAGMKIGAEFEGFDDANRGRQERIAGALEFGSGQGGVSFEMSDLAESVDAGIGASGGVDGERFAGELAEDIDKSALNGGLAGLDLPAVEVGSVVGESEFEGAHQQWSVVGLQ